MYIYRQPPGPMHMCRTYHLYLTAEQARFILAVLDKSPSLNPEQLEFLAAYAGIKPATTPRVLEHLKACGK